MNPLYNKKIIGVSHIKNSNRWRAYINQTNIGNFSSYVEASTARLEVEEIFKNVMSKLDVDSFKFNRDTENISIEVTTNTAEDIVIKTNILYPNSRKQSTTGGAK